MDKKAKLVPVQIEVASTSRRRPSYRWVDGYKVINPQGNEMQPYMRKRAAIRFCKSQGWEYEVTTCQK